MGYTPACIGKRYWQGNGGSSGGFKYAVEGRYPQWRHTGERKGKAKKKYAGSVADNAGEFAFAVGTKKQWRDI